jgi:hypothetical protein
MSADSLMRTSDWQRAAPWRDINNVSDFDFGNSCVLE